MTQTIIGLFLCISLSSCNYTVNLVHTEGQATDTIDDTTHQQPNISPTLAIPLTSGI